MKLRAFAGRTPGMTQRLLMAGAVCASLAACDAEQTTPDEGAPAEGETAAVGKESGKADAWDYRNNPDALAQFAQVELVKKLADLPRKGKAEDTGWPDTYWPTYEDSTNHRWLGKNELSPLEKYDAAFNGWEIPAGFMDLRPFDPNDCAAGFDAEYYRSLGPAARWMSENKGNKPARDLVYRNGEDQAPVCDEKVNEAVERWWGLCHAWGPAAIREKEPIHPVTVNGITFYASDLKALMITIYDSSVSKILGGRCNAKDVERDERGRPKAAECRDTNAGAFHVIMANFLGRHNMALLEDRTYDYQVWNQPVIGFEVTQLTEIDVKKANELLGVEGDAYIYNDKAKKFAEVFATVSYVTESHASREPMLPQLGSYTRTDNYHYILEMDDNGEILGGEWLQGRAQHSTWGVSEQPDFLWFSTGPSVGSWSRSNPSVSYEKVKSLIEQSRKAPEDNDTEDRLVFASEPGADIPDNDPAGIDLELAVENTAKVKNVKLQLDIKHTYIGDLFVELQGPDGFSKIVHEKAGGSADDINKLVEIPELNDKSLAGTWILHVSDNARIDTGKVLRFALVAEPAN